MKVNTDDKGKLLERGGRKATGLKLAYAGNVSRVAVSKLRGLPFLCVMSYDDGNFFGAIA
jgi:hypothetical protein